jgi:hypothetical protein
MDSGRLSSRTRGAHGAPRHRVRAADRPPVRIGSAGRHLRSDAGADGGVGGRAGLECGIDVESALLSTSNTDEHVRPDSSVEAFARLRPVLTRDDPDPTVTAGNASGQNDRAAICVGTIGERAAGPGLRPRARVRSWGVGGVGRRMMGIGPIPAIVPALGRRTRVDRSSSSMRHWPRRSLPARVNAESPRGTSIGPTSTGPASDPTGTMTR